MKILKDTFRPEMARIKRELEALQKLTVRVGIVGAADSELLMIAHVHEYGATITAKNVKNLAIPLTMEAKGKSPRSFNDLEWIPGRQPGVSFLARKKKRRAHNPNSEGLSIHEDYNPDDYTWMYMLVHSVEIPERSFIRASFDNGKGKLDDICKEAVDKIIHGEMTAREAAEEIGAWAAEMTQAYLGALTSPPKADITMKATNSRALLTAEYGRIQKSITYKVEGGD